MSIFSSPIISAIRRQLVVSSAIATFAVVSPTAKAAVNDQKEQFDLISIGLFKTPSAEPFDSNMVKKHSSRLPDLFSTNKQSHGWVTSIRLNLARSGLQSAQLSPKIRFESKGQRIEVTARAHSIRLLWHKSFQ